MKTNSLTLRKLGVAFVIATLAGGVPLAAALAGTAAGDPEAWHVSTPEQPEAVLVKNATVWTSGPQGTLENADLLIRRGKVVEVGHDLVAPKGAVVIDGTGKHVTPGLIDAHSHSFIVGNVNEGTHNITAEVRIEDVINSEEVNMYRQLAGGLTSANQLHGSANAVGGQNCVVKLRYGEDPENLKLEGAKPGIKFALGENPKQSNWGPQNNNRYPQTRSGVEQLIRERFLAARDYMKEWDDHKRGRKRGLPPRRDLQLDALAQILRGEMDVHSHSYRADEILMLTRIADEFGFTIGAFQHILEGYKVADEMAKHGAGASAFSDWWAYKFEVYDAIPYNGSIMWDRGVIVSFNSDSSELARRLNLEAAKAVKYGGIPEEEALKFVTLNPAIQLAIDDRVGSLEAGKDADFVIWNGHPLSSYTLCEQTWVDGRKYFDRQEDLEARETILAEREALLEKIQEQKKEKEDEKKPKDKDVAGSEGDKKGPGKGGPQSPEEENR
jgi:imidazolonepropionase-like amidohydrolase